MLVEANNVPAIAHGTQARHCQKVALHCREAKLTWARQFFGSLGFRVTNLFLIFLIQSRHNTETSPFSRAPEQLRWIMLRFIFQPSLPPTLPPPKKELKVVHVALDFLVWQQCRTSFFVSFALLLERRRTIEKLTRTKGAKSQSEGFTTSWVVVEIYSMFN